MMLLLMMKYTDINRLFKISYVKKMEHFLIASVNLMLNICWKRNIWMSWHDLCHKLCVSPFWVIYTGTVVREQTVILTPTPFSWRWVNLLSKDNILYGLNLLLFPQNFGYMTVTFNCYPVQWWLGVTINLNFRRLVAKTHMKTHGKLTGSKRIYLNSRSKLVLNTTYSN